MYTCVSVCLCVSVFIYIHIHIYTYTSYIYTYIYQLCTCLRNARSPSPTSEQARPPSPALAVRPTRWTYVESSAGSSKLMTVVTPRISSPRPARSVAIRKSASPRLRGGRRSWSSSCHAATNQCFARVPERVSTQGSVVLILGYSKSNHLGAQGHLYQG